MKNLCSTRKKVQVETNIKSNDFLAILAAIHAIDALDINASMMSTPF